MESLDNSKRRLWAEEIENCSNHLAELQSDLLLDLSSTTRELVEQECKSIVRYIERLRFKLRRPGLSAFYYLREFNTLPGTVDRYIDFIESMSSFSGESVYFDYIELLEEALLAANSTRMPQVVSGESDRLFIVHANGSLDWCVVTKNYKLMQEEQLVVSGSDLFNTLRFQITFREEGYLRQSEFFTEFSEAVRVTCDYINKGLFDVKLWKVDILGRSARMYNSEIYRSEKSHAVAKDTILPGYCDPLIGMIIGTVTKNVTEIGG